MTKCNILKLSTSNIYDCNMFLLEWNLKKKFQQNHSENTLFKFMIWIDDEKQNHETIYSFHWFKSRIIHTYWLILVKRLNWIYRLFVLNGKIIHFHCYVWCCRFRAAAVQTNCFISSSCHFMLREWNCYKDFSNPDNCFRSKFNFLFPFKIVPALNFSYNVTIWCPIKLL